MSAPQPRFLATYNSLTDKHLVGYFSNARIRRHLQKSGLISRSGRIIPEKEYRLNAMRRDHRSYVQDCLAEDIFQKALGMEHHHHHHHHQPGLERSLECPMKKQRTETVMVKKFRGSSEGVPMHCPHPPLVPRSPCGLSSLAAGERVGRSCWRAAGLGAGCFCGHCSHQRRSKRLAPSKVSSLRPNTAPGNMQQPHCLQPLPAWAAAGSVTKASKQKCQALEHDQKFACGGNRIQLRLKNSLGYVTGVSPYQFPVIKRRGVPEPSPPSHTRDRCLPRRGLPPSRRYRPTTAFNEQLLIKNNKGYPKSPLCSNALVTMIYTGKSKHVSLVAYKDEVEVYQQHCGGENICVYKGQLMEGDTFQFTSKRYLGYPFSLTFFLNGIQVDRVSCCCEYKHQRRVHLQSTNKYFRVLHVTGAPPCYRCIVAMGLDKKPPLRKRKVKHHKEEHVCCWRRALNCEPSGSCCEPKLRKNSVVVIMPRHARTSVETIEEALDSEEECSEEEMESESDQKSEMENQSDQDSKMENQSDQDSKMENQSDQDSKKENQSDQDSECSLEDPCENEYEEDFEADEEVNEEGQTGDQVNGMSDVSSGGNNHNLDYGKESETSSQKALQASGNEQDESDGYSDRDSEDVPPERRPADSLSSMSSQCSTETDSHAGTMTDNVNGKENGNIKSTSDNAAYVHCGNEHGEKKLLGMKENQETCALEKTGIDEAEKTKPEDLSAREDTRIFHENIMVMQYQNPEVNGEFKQTGSGESNMNEEQKCPPVPWESRALNTEEGKEEPPGSEEGGVFEDCKPVQEEIAKATEGDHPVNSDPDPGDPSTKEEEKNTASTECDASGAAGGSFSAGGSRSLGVQQATGAGRGGQGTGQRQALEQDGAEGCAGSGGTAAKAARAGDSLPQERSGAALEEPGPPESAVAEGQPKGQEGTGDPVRLGTEASPGEQEGLAEGMESEVALEKPAAGGDGPGWEAGGAVPQGQEGAGGIPEEEEAAEEGLKAVAGPPAEEEVSEPGSEESPREGGCAGKETVVGAVSQGEEAAGDADVAADGAARVAGSEGEEAVEEDISEGGEAVGKSRALWEAQGETGETMPGGEGFVKPSEFSQLKASGGEWMETGKAVAGAAEPEGAQAGQGAENALRGVEDAMEEPVEPDRGPVLEVAPGLGALGGARGDPVTAGSSQEEEGAAEALWSGNPSAGSKAETERAVEGKPEGEEGEVVGGSAGAAGVGSGGEEEATDGAAGSKEPAGGTEGWLRCGKVTGKGRSPGEGVVGEAALPPPGLCGTRAGEPGLVAIAVVGGQAGPGTLLGEPALARGPARAGGAGTAAMAREGATGAVLGTQNRTGAAVAQEVPAKGRAAVRESGRNGAGVADGSVAAAGAESQEAAGGCGARAAMLRGQAERAWGAGRPGSPRHGDLLAAMSLGEQPRGSLSTPARGDGGTEPSGRGATGGEGLCLGTRPQLAAPETGTARGQDGRQEEGMERAGEKGEGEQPSSCENTGQSQVADVPAGAGSAAGAGQQSKDGPVGGSAAVLGERSRSPRQDGANPDPLTESSEQPEDGEETLL